MDVNNQRKPLLYYWLIALLIMGVINMFFLPFMTKNTIEQVNYDVFLTQMQNKNISQAEVNEDVIYFYLKDEDKSDKAGTTIFSENTQKVYSTVRMDDPQLVERLYNAGASFGEVKPREVSPWFSTLVMFVVFFLLWQFVMKKAMSKMGGIGNAMSFGKSNAKVYVKAQTGKTFKDVAGQDEAKDALREIVDFLHNPQKYTEIGASMPKGALLVGPPGTGKHCWRRRLQVRQRFPSSPFPARNLWKCLSAWARQRCATFLSRQTKKHPVSYLLMKLIPSGKSVTATAWAATMSGSRH